MEITRKESKVYMKVLKEFAIANDLSFAYSEVNLTKVSISKTQKVIMDGDTPLEKIKIADIGEITLYLNLKEFDGYIADYRMSTEQH